MTLETISACPICHTNIFQPFITAKDYTVSQQDFQIVTCTRCGFTFTNPRPSADTIHQFYQSENYISHTGGSGGLMDRLYRLARNFTLRWKEKIVADYSTGKKLLDYGCGTGNFLGYMKRKKWEVTGVEPAAEAREKASAYATVYPGLDSATETYTAITLWHVLEHIHDLNQKLIDLKNKLAPSGTIFIAVPNYKSADAKHYAGHWAAYDVPRHLWHFDRHAMETALTQAGLKLEKIIPMKLDAYYVALLSESYKKPKATSRYVNAFWQAFKSNHAAARTGEFSSLIYIAKPI
ncbi:MAG: class I SAM-dependent methyltransferase [Cyclobacteriaceae bacterium]|nr:class I SAM-dependent methyltransferase [Cyclobacteriaceae bacterium]